MSKPKMSERCPECNGNGAIFCPACKGSKKDPRNPSSPCSYCNGKGHVTCNICGGDGRK